jgi:hypothetical protein
MAIPEKPESRAEMYLNKIASGSGTIPAQPESRLEQYLDAIARNGGGSGGGSGGGGGVLVVNDVEGVFDKTWQEIYDAPMAVVVRQTDKEKSVYPVSTVGNYGGIYGVVFYTMSFREEAGGYVLGENPYATNSPNGYPAYQSV